MERKIVWAEAQIWGRRGEICASGAPNDFPRSSETPNTTTNYSEEPFLIQLYKLINRMNRIYQRIMQNKPNSLNVQICINIYDTKVYKNETAFRPKKNKPNQTQFQMQSSLAQKMLFATLESRVVMAHLCCYWRTKPKVSDELFRKVVQKC